VQGGLFPTVYFPPCYLRAGFQIDSLPGPCILPSATRMPSEGFRPRAHWSSILLVGAARPADGAMTVQEEPARKGGEGVAEEQYYALCVEKEDGSTQIAFFELGGEALPGALGISVYTAPDGELQRRHLEDGQVVIAAKSPRDLLEAMNTGVPSSVYVDGEKIAGSVFKAKLKDALGMPLRLPRIVRPDPDPE
jgi:hypothetical protein